MIDANICFNGTDYLVKLKSIPAVGDYIQLTSLTELQLQRQHVFTLKVIKIYHVIMEFEEHLRDTSNPSQSVRVHCEVINQ